MAIKFVDIEPEEGRRSKAGAAATATPVAPAAAPAEAAEGASAPEAPAGDTDLLGLSVSKPAPKKPGRKKPLR